MYLQLAEDTYLSKRRKSADKRNPAAVVALAPGRALFLGMLDMNLDGMASKFSKMNFADLRARWLKVGGDPDKLAKFINVGKKKKVKKVGFLKKFKEQNLAEVGNPFLSTYGPSYYLSEGDLTDEQKKKITAICVSAGTTIGSIINPGAGSGAGAAAGTALAQVIFQLYPMIKQAANDPTGETEGSVDPGNTTDHPDNTGTTDEEQAPGMDDKTKKMLLYGGIAAAGIGIIYFMTRKK